jgi:mono/diheme cytochrome c family protein
MRRSPTRSWIILAGAVVSACSAGCGSARKDEVPPTRFRDDPQLRRGQVVFMQTCNQCHVGGGPGLGPGINDKPLPAFAIKTQVRQGVGTMPAFAEEEISDQDLDALVKYLQARREQRASVARK